VCVWAHLHFCALFKLKTFDRALERSRAVWGANKPEQN